MRLLPLILLLLTLIPSGGVSGAEVRRAGAAPRITGVTVYPDRAMTTRSASFSVKPGTWLLALENLPVLLQDDSIRVEGRGTATAVIVGTEVRRIFVDQSPEQRVKELDEELRAAERTLGSIDARKGALAAQKSFIESVKVAWGDRISKELAVGKPTATELNEALAFVGTGITTVEEKARELDMEKKSLANKIEALKRQREQVIGSERKEVKVVEVQVEVAREGTLAIELAAVVPQAGWHPSYDIRLAADGESAELVFRGEVHQQTGEEWNGVELALSTARPAIGGVPPKLFPWHISFYQPPRPMAAAPMARMYEKSARAPMDEEMAFSADAAEPAPHLTARVQEEQSSVLFRIPRPADIPPDGALHGTVVAVEKLPIKLELTTVPKLSPYAFLTSQVENRAAYPLLPGKLNIFSGGNFIGSSLLNKVASGEKYEVHFGADDQVTVKRDELKRHKEAGIFGKNRMTYRYRIEVQNLRKGERTVLVRDQLPLPANEEIKVSLEEPSVKPDEVKDDGTVTWKLVLKPGEKREIAFGIVVEYPKDRELIGL